MRDCLPTIGLGLAWQSITSKVGMNDALIVDADGDLYRISSVTLSPLRWFDWLLAHFNSAGGPKGLCQMDADLEQMDRLSLESFASLVLSRLLANPDLWDDYEWEEDRGWQPLGIFEDSDDCDSMRQEISRKFDDAPTLRAAISELGVWHNPSNSERKKAPDVPVIDLRFPGGSGPSSQSI